MTLDRLAQVVKAMADVVLPQWPAGFSKNMTVCLGVECLSKLVKTMQRVEHLQPAKEGARLGPLESFSLSCFLTVQVDIHTAFNVVPS